ncbi:hypothetical protein BB558_003789 [Smittium angustum]|uniref:VPS9 domain-containing protein n=1 Tax=Smittium angustum TaxID=133377 RepID=A0A2U1J513_SMIAN|nr:hypothetical protein BB558_003789 [Smittium angustum]
MDPNTDPSPQITGPHVSRKPSSSKVQNAIQDIISQFDPIIDPASKNQNAFIGTEFWVDKSGFSYNKFLLQLRNPAAKKFDRRNLSLNEQTKLIHEFYQYIFAKMCTNEVWKDLGDKEKENTKEGVEKLIMNKLYPICFSPASTDDSAKDKVLREKMSLFRWIKESHLDIPSGAQNSSFIEFARAELMKMNEFKSPRDKLICILNCCTVIYGLLKRAEGDVGADSFLPLLIYVIIITNPPRLVSNVQYISRFRSADKLQSEAGYYLTNVFGAISFIESMDSSCLSISQEDFDRHLELSIWEIGAEKRAREKSKLNAKNQSGSKGYWSTLLDEEPSERATRLLEKGSSFAKNTLEKTNQLVGKLLLDLAPNEGPPLPQRAPQAIETLQPTTRNDISLREREETLQLVCDMFPSFDREVCEMVLAANNYLVTESIESLLEMTVADQDDDNPLLSSTSETAAEDVILTETNEEPKNAALPETNANAELTETNTKNVKVDVVLTGNTTKETKDVKNIAVDTTSNTIAEDNEDQWKGEWADDSSEDEK